MTSWSRLRFGLLLCSVLFAVALTSRGFGVVRLNQVFVLAEHVLFFGGFGLGRAGLLCRAG